LCIGRAGFWAARSSVGGQVGTPCLALHSNG
jgi:hypothetical protein